MVELDRAAVPDRIGDCNTQATKEFKPPPVRPTTLPDPIRSETSQGANKLQCSRPVTLSTRRAATAAMVRGRRHDPIRSDPFTDPLFNFNVLLPRV